MTGSFPSDGKFVMLKEGEAYDARARGPNWKFRLVFFPIQDSLPQEHCESWPKRDRKTLEIRNLTIKGVESAQQLHSC